MEGGPWRGGPECTYEGLGLCHVSMPRGTLVYATCHWSMPRVYATCHWSMPRVYATWQVDEENKKIETELRQSRKSLVGLKSKTTELESQVS